MGWDCTVALAEGIGEYSSLLGQSVQRRRFGLGSIEVILPAAVYYYQKNIFDAFFSTKEGGAGLGLSIAKRIIGHHKGEILLESDPGKGTKVIIKIPEAK